MQVTSLKYFTRTTTTRKVRHCTLVRQYFHSAPRLVPRYSTSSRSSRFLSRRSAYTETIQLNDTHPTIAIP
ncbi:hypothetical protein O9993_11650 [Vibrio lentus]|nr:hypothetical protein [Vibrio lentus]